MRNKELSDLIEEGNIGLMKAVNKGFRAVPHETQEALQSKQSDFTITPDSIALDSSLSKTNGNQGTSYFRCEWNEELQTNSCSAIDLSNLCEQARNQKFSTPTWDPDSSMWDLGLRY